MLGFPPKTKVWLAAGKTDMRKGFDGLAATAKTLLQEDPLSGHVFVFRGRSGVTVKTGRSRPSVGPMRMCPLPMLAIWRSQSMTARAGCCAGLFLVLGRINDQR